MFGRYYPRCTAEREKKPIENSTRHFFEKKAEEGLELRPGQLEMAMEICNTINEHKPLAVEAEVGIGKSYAYLIPAVYEYMNTGRQIVIATSTIALQEQLSNDAKKVLEMTGASIDIYIAKGMRNYVCPKRLKEETEKNKTENIYEDIRLAMIAVSSDRAEMGINIPDNIWNSVCVQGFGDKCNDCFEKCFCSYRELRHDLKNRHGIVICNQNLLVAHYQNLRNGGKGIFNPDGEIVIIDEAHNLESKFRSSFTLSYTKDEQSSLINRCIPGVPKTSRESAEQYALETIEIIERLYKMLVRQVREQQRETEADTSTYYFKKDTTVKSLIKIILKRITKLDEMTEIPLDNLITFWDGVINSYNRNLLWLEMDGKLRICVCQKEIRDDIYRMLFAYSKRVILTSATISDKAEGTPAEKCGYFLHNIAFPVVGNVSEPKRSPFDYDNNTMLYCCSKLPRPTQDNKEEYRESSINEIVRLLDITHGKTLILFTAKADMEYVYKRLSNMHLPYKILMQGKGSSQARQLDKFKNDVNSVILGTGTYWEGINVEGEALSQVIIFKLPFPVPDPIIDYKMSLVEDKVKEVAVPEMIIKLKQGTGRLIRSSTDTGIVSILDPRASSREKCFYRNIILESLCEKNSTEDMRVIAEFWNRLNTQKEAV